MRWSWVFAGVLVVSGCKRVDKEIRLADLTDEETLALCESVHQDEWTLTCGGEPFVVPESDDALCVERLEQVPVTCQATVADLRDCDRARRNDDPCMPTMQILEACDWETDSSCFYAY